MLGCNGCQERLLDYLYDLLEEADQRALSDHLAGCPTCQAALEKARGQQQLLARAARLSFPEARFTPPAEPLVPAAAEPAREILLPVRPRLQPSRSLTRWAVAAAVLVAVGTAAVPIYRTRQEVLTARQAVEAHDRVVADARRQVEEAQRQVNAAAVERDRQIEEVRKAAQDRQLRLIVSGPRTIQPGAPAEFQVTALDLHGQPAEAEILARLALSRQSATSVPRGAAVPPQVADRDKPARREEAAALSVSAIAAGQYRVSVPPTVRLQPGQSLDMLVSARRKAGRWAAKQAETRPAEPVTVEGSVRLTAPVYVTHLTTDKPMYQPGEVVHFRSLTLDRLTLAPPADDFRLHYSVTTPLGAVQTITRGTTTLLREESGKQTLVNGPDGKPVRGIGAGELPLDTETAGGEYTLAVREEQGRFPPVTRKFTVNRYQKPRLDKKLDFNRSTYGPGDEVQARVVARRADGGPVGNRPVEVSVNVDDRLFDRDGKPAGGGFRLTTDDQGVVVVRFRLPQAIDRGQASLTVTFDDNGVVEPIVRTVPLVLNKLQVEFFPEGGDLVAGLANRVYFQARTPLGKPAQLKGLLLEDGQPLSVPVETLHDDVHPGVNQGNGSFTFTPRSGKKYELRIDEPKGISERKPLPAALADGVVLHVPGGVFEAGAPLRVQVHSTRPRSLLVGAYCRGQLLDTVQLEKGQSEVILRPSSGAGGVCRVTVFEELNTGRPQLQLRPVAERLVYRQPRERLDVSLSTDQRRYVPGQKVKLSLLTTDETEKPRPAIALVAVADNSVVTLADEKTARTMPTHFLLTTEVRRADDLEYADFLLGPRPKAATALDLLLGTQGWRRFAEQSTDEFRRRQLAPRSPGQDHQRDGEEAERFLVLTGQSQSRTTDLDQDKIERVAGVFASRLEQLGEQHREAAVTLEEAGEDESYRAALARLDRWEEAWRRGNRLAGPVLAVLLLALLPGLLISALRRQVRGARGFAGAAAACGLLLALSWSQSRPGPEPLATRPAREVAQLQIAPAAPALEAEERLARPFDAGVALPMEGMAQPPGIGGGQGMEGKAMLGAAMMPGAPMVPPQKAMLADAAPAGPAGPGRVLALGIDNRDRFAKKLAAPEAKQLAERQRGDAFRRRQAGGMGGRLDMRLRKADELDRDFREQPAMPGLLPGGGPAAAGAPGMPAADRAFGVRPNAEAEVPSAPLVIREYAHVHRPGESVGLRSDFTETICWHPVLVLPDGKATVSFDLSDSVTSFQAVALVHSLDGRLGAGSRLIESGLPFTLAAKVPQEVTAGDQLDIPVAITNNTTDARPLTLRLDPPAGLETLAGKTEERFSVPAEGRARRTFRFRPTLTDGTASLWLNARADPLPGDALRETIRVVPDGFPIVGSSSDLLEKSATHKVQLPAWLPGTLAVQVDVYPSTLADLQKGLDGLLREPSGCFEQTSTSNYPNVLILDYLKASDQANPELEKRTRDLLERGYRKLTSFECQDPARSDRRGYEWFGGTAPPHEALTAYGLLQFRDMARVSEVDRAMLERTRQYLLARRDGKGGFTRNPRALDSFGQAPEAITNAYIVWALTEGGKEDDLTVEQEALLRQAATSNDPYFLSLVAIGLANRGRSADAGKLLDKVAKAQKADGHLDAAQTSITSSGGRDLQIETTALALLGWMKTNAGAYDAAIRKAVQWVGQQRGGYGGFGSTQSTILALKALIAYTNANKRTPEAGQLRLFVGDEKVAELSFPAGVDRPLTLTVPDAEKRLKAGDNSLRVEITGAKNVFPHTLSWTYRTTKPASVAAPVELTTRLARSSLVEGESVRLNVQLRNVSGKNQGMTVAIVGLPAGLILPEDLKQLKEHIKLPTDGSRPLLGAFEVKGRELVLYWRDLGQDQTVEVPIDLIARVPGVYRGPASRGYLYYNADAKHWLDPLAVTISARE